MYYAKKVDNEGKLLCLWTYDNTPPVFYDTDVNCMQITEDEYNALVIELQSVVEEQITGEEVDNIKENE